MRLERKAVEKLVTDGEEKDELHYSVVGSPDYMAVEVLCLPFSSSCFFLSCVQVLRGEGYTSVVDFWAIGCMMYEMIFGFPPFFGESPEEVFMNIVNYDQCLAFPEPGQGNALSFYDYIYNLLSLFSSL
jgi:serine/threonine kinase 38